MVDLLDNYFRVAIIDSCEQKSKVGVGTFIPPGYLLTCAHVIKAADCLPPYVNRKVLFYFPTNEKISDSRIFSAKVIMIGDEDTSSRNYNDWAILEMISSVASLSQSFLPMNAANNISYHSQKVFLSGFPSNKQYGEQSEGELLGRNEFGLIDIKPCAGEKIPGPGYSGSPVWCVDSKTMLGMFIGDDEFKRSFMLSLADIKRFWPRGPLYSIVEMYGESQCILFKEKEEPYCFKSDEFVKSVDFSIGGLGSFNDPTASKKGDDLQEYIIKKIEKDALFCLAEYGMGKSTIAMHLFQSLQKCSDFYIPVFIEMKDVRLKDYCGESQLRGKIKRRIESVIYWEKDRIITINNSELDAYRENQKLLLIIDGLDEAVADRTTIGEFARTLREFGCRFFLTCRLEYPGFKDRFSGFFPNKNNVVKLLPWGKRQWNKYVNSLIKRDGVEWSEKNKTLNNNFFNSLMKGEYGSLGERPLFLHMLLKILCEGDGSSKSLPSVLNGNKAGLFYFFINWKIRDDFKRKRGALVGRDVDEGEFLRDVWMILEEIAIKQYQRYISLDGVVNIEYNRTARSEIIIIINQLSDSLMVIDKEYMEDALKQTSLFSIIQVKSSSGGIKFSHKSFQEYLVAKSLANGFFSSDKEKAFCSSTWNFFQTHEVSALFVEEIKRLNGKGNNNSTLLARVARAFEKELLSYSNLEVYNERYEEVLFYTGKLRLSSKIIESKLYETINSKESVHPIFYRTSRLSLALMGKTENCFDYVMELFSDSDKFEVNNKIQLRYYGGQLELRERLKYCINNYLTNCIDDNLFYLKLFSYFMCGGYTEKTYKEARKEELIAVKSHAEKKRDLHVLTILGKMTSSNF